VDGLEEGSQIHAGELSLPGGSTLVTDPEALILSIQLPPKVVEPEPDAVAEGEAGGEGVEGEAAAEGGDAGGESGGDDACGE